MDGIEHSIDEKWDLIIAHPPCTYLSNAGARWLYSDGELNAERYRKGLDGKNFFMAMINADCQRIAVENPIPSSIYDCRNIRKSYSRINLESRGAKKLVFG